MVQGEKAGNEAPQQTAARGSEPTGSIRKVVFLNAATSPPLMVK